jgi:hypothetical protein
MKVYLFSHPDYLMSTGLTKAKIMQVLDKIAQDTDTRDLVTALYILRSPRGARGTAYVRNWITRDGFITKRGHWSLTQKWNVPTDLPSKFKLIRMHLDGRITSFPKKEMDVYGWELKYGGFHDRLASLFAHELHHFRRYHLDFHTREGEHSANKWALQRVRDCGYDVICTRRIKQKKKRAVRFSRFKKTPFGDPYASFHRLQPGDRLYITHDPRGRYTNESVTVIRSIRSNSKRIVIQTSDQQIWRWPMHWLKIPTQTKS